MNQHFSPLDAKTVARILGGEASGNRIVAPGPNHSSGDRSLSVLIDASAPDGFVVHSFSGDDARQCRDHVNSKLGRPAWTPVPKEASADIIARMGAAAQGSPRHRVVAEYPYHQADGTPYLRVQRTDAKAFWQSHWTGSGWAKGKPDGPKIPYRLPEMHRAVHNTVFVCEGEKDADELTRRGFTATTSSEGAGKWTADLNEHFRDWVVYILADNDEAGAKHARQVAENLAGVAESVRIVDLPGLPSKGDVSDWLAAGNDHGLLIDLCRRAPIFEAGHQSQDHNRDHIPDHKRQNAGLIIRSAADLRHKRFPDIRFVVPGLIVEGCTLLAGRPKLGKSWLVLDLGLAVAAGRYCLGETKCIEGDVLYLALEDNERRLQSRITKVLGTFGVEWPERFHYATEWPRANEGGVEAIRDWITKAQDPRLVVVDVLAMFKPVRGSRETLYEADYAALKGLQSLAGEFGVAIVVVHHTRKSQSEADPFEKVSGTLGLSGAADTTVVLDRDGNGASLYGRGRDIEEFETAVAFDKPTCRWTILGAASDVRRTDERGSILTALKDADAPMSPTDIADATMMSNQNVRQLLVSMVKDGEVKKVTRARYIHPERADLDHKQTPDHNDHKITNLDAYRRTREGDDEDG